MDDRASMHVPDRPKVLKVPKVQAQSNLPHVVQLRHAIGGRTRGGIVTRHYRVTRSDGRRYKLQRRPTYSFFSFSLAHSRCAPPPPLYLSLSSSSSFANYLTAVRG